MKLKTITAAILLGAVVSVPSTIFAATETGESKSADKNTEQPNILVIWGDDIGWQNVSAYGMGTMGYTTPNIDRIGMEGIRFTDHYGEPSCTAGRAAFATGQYPIRSGLTTVGQPGDPRGLMQESPSIGEVFKNAGYATGQFGKNHLGDNNTALPTVHGFDEFFGLLYHLNVLEEAEQLDYKNFAAAYPGGAAAYKEKFGSRNLIHSYATDKDDPTVDERFGRVGKQRVEDAGPLHRKRMMDFDGGEVAPFAMDFMLKAKKAGKPFFVWLNTSRMHIYTRLNEKWRYAAAKDTTEADYQGSGMLQHDHDIGVVLDFLKDNDLEDNTIVWYSTDNGPEHVSWPHGSTTPFRGGKMGTYEGGVRILSMLRWPGKIKGGQIKNGMQNHYDMFTTLAAAAGIKDVKENMMKEKKQILDGVNNLDYWLGKSKKSERRHHIYYYESEIMAMRMGPWKWHFSDKEDYYSNVQPLTVPKVFNIRMDPFESYDSVDSYGHLLQKVSWQMGPLGDILGKHLKTLVEYPPVQGGKSFNMSHMVHNLLKKGSQ